VLKSPEALELLFGAIARTSVTEAFYFSRKSAEPARQQLFQQLISSVLGTASRQEVPSRAAELVSLPLDELEEGWFSEYLTAGDGRKHKRAKDTLTMRSIITGKHTNPGDTSLGSQWGLLLQGVKLGER
jgi:hypothetical protein